MDHSSEPSIIVRRWLSIFWRAAWSMRASCMRSSSRILRTSRRMVLRSSMNSTSSRSATASVTTWASLLTLSRLKRTVRESSPGAFFSCNALVAMLHFQCFSSNAKERPMLKNGLIFFRQFGLNFAEHLLIIGAALLHFVGIGFEDDTHLIVNAVLKG